MSRPRGRIRARCWLVLSCLLVAAAGCSEPKPAVGGNTNWLARCDDDAPCDSETSCVCGRCSVRCSASAECAGWPGSTCAGEVAVQLQCGGSEDTRLCLLGCESDADCSADLACVQGACVERAQRTLCSDHPQALFCSGFDSDELDEWSITAAPDSTLAATAMYRHAGESSLQARSIGVQSRTRFTGEFAVQSSGTLYLRVWMFVEPGTVLRNIHTITIGDVDTPDWGVNFQFYEGAHRIETPTVLPTGDGVPVTVGRWFCLQGEITLSDSEGSVRAFVDGSPVASMTGIDTLPGAGARSLTAGIDHSAQPEPASVFFDELLLDRQPTPCAD